MDGDYLVPQLQCSACAKFMLPPLMQCRRGHTICKRCNSVYPKCLMCNTALTNIRNLLLEKAAPLYNYGCKNARYGCRTRSAYLELTCHEDQCDTGPYTCRFPDADCLWSGQTKDVKKHFESAHTDIHTIKGTEVVFLATNYSHHMDWVLMQCCHRRKFLISLEKKKLDEKCEKISATCRLIGSVLDASNYVFTISLEANSQKHVYTAKMNSICQKIKATMVLSKYQIEPLLENNQLKLDVTIRRVHPIGLKNKKLTANKIRKLD